MGCGIVMKRMVLSLLITVAVAYLALCVGVCCYQRSLIYFPTSTSRGKSAGTMTLAVDGAQILVTVVPHEGPNALIYFGGNAEDVSCSSPSLAAAFPEHAIYLSHYRGYGGSSGKPSEKALVADGLALFDQVHNERQNITVVGRSLGSGVAVQLAALRPVVRVVLVTPFDSLQGIAAREYPYLPIRWLLRDKFESWKYAPRIVAPTVLVAAEHDEIIPRTSTEALLERFAPGVASFNVVAGASHNDIAESPEYIRFLRGER